MVHRLTRRSTLGVIAGACAAPAIGQTPWPNRSVTLVHGFAPGGNVDVISRLYAARLSARLGQNVVVDGRPGAGGNNAAAAVARSAPDGYTLTVVPAGHAISPAIYKRLPFDAMNDFTFVGMLTDFPLVLVTYKDHVAGNVADILKAGRKDGEPFTYGSSGVGTGPHMAGLLFGALTGVPMQHVPYRGNSLALTDLISGRIDFSFSTPTGLLDFIKAGSLRAIATTGRTRFFSLPDVPTVEQAGVPGYEATSWLGLAGPRGLPPEIVARLNADTKTILSDPEAVTRLQELGSEAKPTTPDEFRSRVDTDIRKWTDLVERTQMERM